METLDLKRGRDGLFVRGNRAGQDLMANQMTQPRLNGERQMEADGNLFRIAARVLQSRKEAAGFDNPQEA